MPYQQSETIIYFYCVLKTYKNKNEVETKTTIIKSHHLMNRHTVFVMNNPLSHLFSKKFRLYPMCVNLLMPIKCSYPVTICLIEVQYDRSFLRYIVSLRIIVNKTYENRRERVGFGV